MSSTVTVAISLKSYFGHHSATEWFTQIAERVSQHRMIASGEIEVLIFPTYLQILPALEAFRGVPVQLGAQDVSSV